MAEPEQPTPERAPRKSPTEAAALNAPWLPTPWTPADVLSIQRLHAGTANAIEQKQALAWIIAATGVNGQLYQPGGEAGRRDTDFALGAANVGRQIVKLVKLDLSKLRGDEHGEHG